MLGYLGGGDGCRQRRRRCGGFAALDVCGVEALGLLKHQERSLQLVSARLGDHVHEGGPSVSVLGAGAGGLDVDLLDGFVVEYRVGRSGHGVVDLHAVDLDLVLVGVILVVVAPEIAALVAAIVLLLYKGLSATARGRTAFGTLALAVGLMLVLLTTYIILSRMLPTLQFRWNSLHPKTSQRSFLYIPPGVTRPGFGLARLWLWR